MEPLAPRTRNRATGWTHARQVAFLKHLHASGNVCDACAEVGLSRGTAYKLRDRNAEFARLWDLAVAAHAAVLLDEARGRAMQGNVRAVKYKGRIVGERVVYSDRLLAAALFRGAMTFSGKDITENRTTKLSPLSP